VGLTGGSDNIGDFQQKAHAQIRAFAGKERPFRCYVNPARPEQAVLFRDLRWGLMLLMSVFPLVFPLAGFAISISGGWQARKTALARRLESQHPGEPWRWRTEWGGESIQASPNALLILLGIGGWILLVQGPLALAIIVSGELTRVPLSALALLPSLLALIPLSLVWRRYKTRRAFGRPSLWLKQTPIRPGHTLEGELRFDRVLSPREVIQARLLCQRQITRRSGNGSTTTNETLWEHTETLSAAEARREMSGVALPLRVEIPRGLPCPVVEDGAFISGGSEQHVWSLELTPGNGGKPAVLPLPVFGTGEDSVLAESEAPREIEAIEPSTEQLVERLKHGGVQVEFDAAGLPTLFVCPPGRFRFLSFFLLIFGSIWFIVFLVLMSQGAPWIFRIVWGITSPLILGIGLWTLLHHRRVEISRGRAAHRESYRPLLLVEGKLRPAPLRRFHARLQHAVRQPVLLPRPRRDDLRQKENPHRRHHRIHHRRDAGEAAGGLEEAHHRRLGFQPDDGLRRSAFDEKGWKPQSADRPEAYPPSRSATAGSTRAANHAGTSAAMRQRATAVAQMVRRSPRLVWAGMLERK
jgi:hypothetical protein